MKELMKKIRVLAFHDYVPYVELKRMEESDIMSDQKDQRTMIPSTGLEDLHPEYQFQHCRLSTQDQNYARQPSIHKYSFYVVLFTFFFEAIRYTEYLTINSLYN